MIIIITIESKHLPHERNLLTLSTKRDIILLYNEGKDILCTLKSSTQSFTLIMMDF